MKKKLQPTRLVRSMGSVWENWEFSQYAPLRIEDTSEPRGGPNSVLAVPARNVVAAPIWIKATDPEIVRSSIGLELDLRGLLPKKRKTDAVVSRTIVQGERTLVVAMIFPSVIPEILGTQSFSRYEASPLLLHLEDDSATFWKEGSDLVVAFTRGPHVVYWATAQLVDYQSLEKWVGMLVVHLKGLGILEKSPTRFLIAKDVEGSEELFPEVFTSGAHLNFERAAISPSLDCGSFEWKPESAHHAERKSLATIKVRKVLVSLAAIYGVVALLCGLYVGLLSTKEKRLKARVANLENQVGSFEPIIQEWQAIGPSAEQQVFPLEILHFVVKNLPKDGIRLTTYDVTDGNVVIEGEAASASLASQFFAAVSKESGLSGFHWEMPPPALLPSSAARFHITGAAQ